MRIALVGPTLPSWHGSVAQHTTHLAHALATAGHEVMLESWSRLFPERQWRGEPEPLAEPEALFPATRRSLSWHRPDGWWRAGARFRRERSDGVVVVVATPLQVPAYLPMVAATRRRGLPNRPQIVAICHNLLPHKRRVIEQPLMHALLCRLDGVLTHSAVQAELARRFTHAPVHLAALPPRPPHPADCSAAAQPAPGPAQATVHRHLLFFGTVRPYKGLDLLLSALAGFPGVRLTVAGEFWGDGLRRTEDLIADLGVADRVRLRPGYVAATDLPALFRDVDALVLPYRRGTATQNVHVAHAYGVPVIATRVGTLPDDVRDGVDGVVCAPGEAAALAAALRRFYAEGTPQRLRAAVRPADTPAMWGTYITILAQALGAATGPTAPAFTDFDDSLG